MLPIQVTLSSCVFLCFCVYPIQVTLSRGKNVLARLLFIRWIAVYIIVHRIELAAL